jgi:hypothetical protein
MPTLAHYCEECDSEYQIKYELEKCEDSPHYCPFCSSYILEDDAVKDEDE